MKIPLDKITWDQQLYPRTGVDWVTAHVYAESMRAGAKFPPIDAVKRDGGYLGLDGRHRCTAAHKNGVTEIEARILNLSGNDLLLHAVKSNLKHGRPLSTYERLQIAQRLRTDFGMSILKVAGMLQIPKKSLLSLLDRRLTPRGKLGDWQPPDSNTGTSADVVLKAPFEHMAGTALTSETVAAQRISAVTSQAKLLEQVVTIARADAFDLKTAEVREALRELLTWLSKNKTRLGDA